MIDDLDQKKITSASNHSVQETKIDSEQNVNNRSELTASLKNTSGQWDVDYGEY